MSDAVKEGMNETKLDEQDLSQGLLLPAQVKGHGDDNQEIYAPGDWGGWDLLLPAQAKGHGHDNQEIYAPGQDPQTFQGKQ